jgi:hypothetical protein
MPGIASRRSAECMDGRRRAWASSCIVALVEPRSGRDGDLPGRRVTRWHRPWPGCWAPTNPPRRRARPSRSRMAHAHGTPRRSGLPGRDDARLVRQDRRCRSSADATGACRWTTESNAVPWPWPRGHGVTVSARQPYSTARREDHLGLPGLLRRFSPSSESHRQDRDPPLVAPSRLTCRTLPSVPGHQPHDGCLRMRRGR